MSTGKVAKLLGISVKTLQRWEHEGRLIPAARTDSNRRLYTESQLREFQGIRQSGGVTPARRVAYCRVSSAAQKPDLANQRRVLEEFVVAKGLANVEFIEKVGGGLNFKRKQFPKSSSTRSSISSFRGSRTSTGTRTPGPSSTWPGLGIASLPT